MSVSDAKRQDDFWTDSKVAWYIRANARSDYAETVLGVAGPVLAGCRTALDIGAGFGALAVPLALRLARVTALEPAPSMAEALRAEATARALDNLGVIQAAWGAVALWPHDLVVCAHVGPLLGADSPLLPALSRLARRAVLLVRDAPGGDDKFFFREFYPLLRGHPYERCCDYAETLAALAALGVHPTVTTIEYSSDQPFDRLEEACDFWMAYMGLTGEDVRAVLTRLLGERLRRDGTGWVAPFRKRAAVMAWRTDGSAPP